MASRKENKLRGGLSALLGEPKGASSEEEEGLINSVEDEELKSLLRAKQMERRGRPRKDAAIAQRESEVYCRTTLIIERVLLAKLKEISFRETITLKDIISEIIGTAVRNYEETHGKIVPKDHKGDASALFGK